MCLSHSLLLVNQLQIKRLFVLRTVYTELFFLYVTAGPTWLLAKRVNRRLLILGTVHTDSLGHLSSSSRKVSHAWLVEGNNKQQQKQYPLKTVTATTTIKQYSSLRELLSLWISSSYVTLSDPYNDLVSIFSLTSDVYLRKGFWLSSLLLQLYTDVTLLHACYRKAALPF